MTTAYERTKSVVGTREFLQTLASADEVNVRGLVQTVAICLLRHYPLDIDIEMSAAALPEIWAPLHRKTDGAARQQPRKSQKHVPGWRDADDVRGPEEDDDQTA
jgi:hypothetical protein